MYIPEKSNPCFFRITKFVWIIRTTNTAKTPAKIKMLSTMDSFRSPWYGSNPLEDIYCNHGNPRPTIKLKVFEPKRFDTAWLPKPYYAATFLAKSKKMQLICQMYRYYYGVWCGMQPLLTIRKWCSCGRHREANHCVRHIYQFSQCLQTCYHSGNHTKWWRMNNQPGGRLLD